VNAIEKMAFLFCMNILVTGANGFLGYHLVQQLLDLENSTIIATGRNDLQLLPLNKNLVYQQMDFTDPFAVHDVFEKFKPGVVIHAGAMANVDACEKDQWLAYVTNVEGTLTLLANAEECQAHFIHVSTDFVFDGVTGPYDENSKTRPVNFYGRTKRDAEDAVKEYPFDWTIVRTVLIYGNNPTGRDNILTAVRKKLSAEESYAAVSDIVRTATWVGDLSQGIVSIIKKKKTGIFHLSGPDALTAYEMACKTANYLGLDSSLLKKIQAADLNAPAIRPPRTVFILDKAKRELDYQPVSFEEGLKKTFT
jgi:dTDP-4-dehydrorhamnose reductase